MKSIRLLVKRLADAGVFTTDNINEAIYIFPDGTMIDGQFMDGMRTVDHRCIFSGVNYPDYYSVSNTQALWKRLHREYRLVRLVPESKTALISGRQHLTNIQKHMILESGYIVERY